MLCLFLDSACLGVVLTCEVSHNHQCVLFLLKFTRALSFDDGNIFHQLCLMVQEACSSFSGKARFFFFTQGAKESVHCECSTCDSSSSFSVVTCAGHANIVRLALPLLSILCTHALSRVQSMRDAMDKPIVQAPASRMQSVYSVVGA